MYFILIDNVNSLERVLRQLTGLENAALRVNLIIQNEYVDVVVSHRNQSFLL